MPTGVSAQEFLNVDTIREDVLILKDGGIRVILMCSSVNFALKSTDEQDAIVYQYQNFLNALDFPLQFVIHSRKLNIDSYLESLKQRQKEETNDLLKVQISEYVEFIRTFVELTNIMSKTFYVVVPFTPPFVEKKGAFGAITSTLGFGKNSEVDKNNFFEEYKNQLWQRVDAVIGGLGRFGIRSVPLNTEELIELFYGLYNPTEFEHAVMAAEEVKR